MAGCGNNSEKARALLEKAEELVHQNQAGEAEKVLQTVVNEYGGSREAAEATHLLTVLEAARNSQPSEENLKHELLVAVGRFALDCGRYSAQQEGFRVLLENPGLAGWKGPYLDRQWTGRIGSFEYRLRGDKPEITSRH